MVSLKQIRKTSEQKTGSETEETRTDQVLETPTIQLNGEYKSGKSLLSQEIIDQAQELGLNVMYVGSETAGIKKDRSKIDADWTVVNDNMCPGCNSTGDFGKSLKKQDVEWEDVDLILSEGTGNPTPDKASEAVNTAPQTEMLYNLMLINGENNIDVLEEIDRSITTIGLNRPKEIDEQTLQNYLQEKEIEAEIVAYDSIEGPVPKLIIDENRRPKLTMNGTELIEWSSENNLVSSAPTGIIYDNLMNDGAEQKKHKHRDKYFNTIDPRLDRKELEKVKDQIPEEDLSKVAVQINHPEYIADIDNTKLNTQEPKDSEIASSYFVVTKKGAEEIPQSVLDAFGDYEILTDSCVGADSTLDYAKSKVQRRKDNLGGEDSYENKVEAADEPIGLPNNYSLTLNTAVESAIIWEDEELEQDVGEAIDEITEAAYSIDRTHWSGNSFDGEVEPIEIMGMAQDLYWAAPYAGNQDEQEIRENAAKMLYTALNRADQDDFNRLQRKSDSEEWFEYMDHIVVEGFEKGYIPDNTTRIDNYRGEKV